MGLNTLSDCHKIPYMRYQEFDLYKLRQVGKHCSVYIIPIRMKTRVMLHKRLSKLQSRHMCKACLKWGRIAVHHGLCRRCRPQYAPELKRRTITNVFGLSTKDVEDIRWRRSHPPLRKITLATLVWEKMKEKAAIYEETTPRARYMKRLRQWVKQGEDNFFREIYKRKLYIE